MPRPPIADSQPNFAGGLNAIASEVALLPNQVSEAVNARLTQFGGISKRGGTQRITSSTLHATGVRGLIEWDMSDGTRYMLATANGTLYWASYGTFPITFTSVAGALDATAYTSLVAFRDATGDAMYLADGGLLNKLTVAAGPTFTLSTDIASTPIITSVEVFNQRLWACGSTAFPQAIFFSELNDGDTLGIGASGGGQINVRTFGQQNVTAIKALGTSLLIFHKGGVSRLTGFGQDDTVAVPAGVTGEVGTTAPGSVVRVENIIYYVNVRGLFVATAEGVMPVSTPEKPDPLSNVLPSLTDTQLAGVTSVFYKGTRELMVHVPSVGTYVFHTLLQSWSGPWTGTYLSTGRQVFAEVGTASDVPVLLKGNTDGFIELVDAVGVFTDSATAAGVAGSSYALSVTCRRQFAGDFASAKSYRWGYVLADLQGATGSTLSWQTDQSGGSSALSQTARTYMLLEDGDSLVTELGGAVIVSSSTQSLRVPVWGTGYYIDLSLQDTSTNTTPVFSRIEVTGYSLGRR